MADVAFDSTEPLQRAPGWWLPQSVLWRRAQPSGWTIASAPAASPMEAWRAVHHAMNCEAGAPAGFVVLRFDGL